MRNFHLEGAKKSIQDLPTWIDLSLAVGEQVKKIRQALGMTQEQLAERTGFTQSYIAEIESGRKENLELFTIKKIAQGLNCQLLIQVIPQKNLSQLLDEQSTKVAQKIISLSSASTALERQLPDQEFIANEVEEMKKNILEKHRSALWLKI